MNQKYAKRPLLNILVMEFGFNTGKKSSLDALDTQKVSGGTTDLGKC